MGRKTDKPSPVSAQRSSGVPEDGQLDRFSMSSSLFWTVAVSGTLVALLTSGCSGLGNILDPSTPTGAGMAQGLAGAAQAVGDGVSALETGGWAAAAVVTGLGLVKAISRGWKKASDMAERTVVAGCKKHADNGVA